MLPLINRSIVRKAPRFRPRVRPEALRSSTHPLNHPILRHHHIRNLSTSTSLKLYPSRILLGDSSKEKKDSEESRDDPAVDETPIEPPNPSQPLPDLRHGIPSTFAQEYMKQESSKEKKGEEEQNLNEEPDITQQEAEFFEAKAGGSGTSGRGAPPKSAYETSIDKRRAAVARYFYLLCAALIGGGAVYYGRNWDTEAEELAHPDVPSGWGPTLMYNRMKVRLNEWLGYYMEPTFPKLLPLVPDANIPPYTLVISLEDMLVRSEWTREHGWRAAKRPGADFFLLYLSQYYELCLFTSVSSAMGMPIYSKLDPYHIIMWPLYREATRYDNGDYVKDLNYLNRPLEKTILLDTKASHAKAQPQNAIIIPPWDGDPEDRGLINLIPFLEHIAAFQLPDVRNALKSYQGKDIAQEFAKREARMREELLKQQKATRKGGVGKLAGGLTGRLPTGNLNIGGEIEQGKTVFDLIREEGMKKYKFMEEQIRENGQKWLEEEKEMIKKAEAEQIDEMKKGMFSWIPGMSGSKPAPKESPPSPTA